MSGRARVWHGSLRPASPTAGRWGWIYAASSAGPANPTSHWRGLSAIFFFVKTPNSYPNRQNWVIFDFFCKEKIAKKIHLFPSISTSSSPLHFITTKISKTSKKNSKILKLSFLSSQVLMLYKLALSFYKLYKISSCQALSLSQTLQALSTSSISSQVLKLY